MTNQQHTHPEPCDLLAHLFELERSEHDPFTARGGSAPRTYGEHEGAPAHTRGGIPRTYGRVARLPGAE